MWRLLFLALLLLLPIRTLTIAPDDTGALVVSAAGPPDDAVWTLTSDRALLPSDVTTSIDTRLPVGSLACGRWDAGLRCEVATPGWVQLRLPWTATLTVTVATQGGGFAAAVWRPVVAAPVVFGGSRPAGAPLAWLQAACGIVGEDIPRPWYVSDPFTGEDRPCPDDATPTPVPPTPTPGPLVPRQYAPLVLRGPPPPPPVWRAYAPLVFVRAGPDVPR